MGRSGEEDRKSVAGGKQDVEDQATLGASANAGPGARTKQPSSVVCGREAVTSRVNTIYST